MAEWNAVAGITRSKVVVLQIIDMKILQLPLRRYMLLPCVGEFGCSLFDPARNFSRSQVASQWHGWRPRTYLRRNASKSSQITSISAQWMDIFLFFLRLRFPNGSDLPRWRTEIGRWKCIPLLARSLHVAEADRNYSRLSDVNFKTRNICECAMMGCSARQPSTVPRLPLTQSWPCKAKFKRCSCNVCNVCSDMSITVWVGLWAFRQCNPWLQEFPRLPLVE